MVSYAHAQRLTVTGSAEAERAARIVDLVQQSTALVRSISKGLHPIEMGGDALWDVRVGRFRDNHIEVVQYFNVNWDCPLPVAGRLSLHGNAAFSDCPGGGQQCCPSWSCHGGNYFFFRNPIAVSACAFLTMELECRVPLYAEKWF